MSYIIRRELDGRFLKHFYVYDGKKNKNVASETAWTEHEDEALELSYTSVTVAHDILMACDRENDTFTHYCYIPKPPTKKF